LQGQFFDFVAFNAVIGEKYNWLRVAIGKQWRRSAARPTAYDSNTVKLKGDVLIKYIFLINGV